MELISNESADYGIASNPKNTTKIINNKQQTPNRQYNSLLNITNYSTFRECSKHHLSTINNSESECCNCCNCRKLEKGQTLLTSYFSYATNTAEASSQTLQLKEKYKCYRDDAHQSLTIRQSKCIKQKYRRLLIALQKKYKHLIEKLRQIRTLAREKYKNEYNRRSHQNIDAWFLNICFKVLDVYMHASWNLDDRNMKKTSKNNAIEVIAAGRGIQKLQTMTIAEPTPTVDGAGQLAGGAAIVNNDSASRRLIRGNKTADNVRMMFLTDSKEETLEKDACK